MIDTFVSDIQCDDALYACIIRSPVCEGTLRAVEAPPLPEGCALYTVRHIPHEKDIALFDSVIPVFAESGIAYKGQAAGILVADNPLVLQDIQTKVTVDIEPLPAETIEACSERFFNYPIIAQKTDTAGNSAAVLETAPLITYSSLDFEPQPPFRAEPFSVIAQTDGEVLRIFVPTAYPVQVREAVARVTGWDYSAITVHPTKTGFSSDVLLWYPSLIACQCAVAAVQSGKTVRLTLSSEETELAVPKTPQITVHCKSALSETQSLAALHIFITVKAGALCPLITHILAKMIAAARGMYSVPSYRIEAVALKTPHGLTDVFESRGEYFILTALENHISTVIQENNLIPSEWRLDNADPAYRPLFSDLFEHSIPKSDFLRKNAAYSVFNKVKKNKHDGKIRGIGLASGFEYTGCLFDSEYSVELCLETDGSFTVKTAAINEYIKNIAVTLITEQLEIAEEQIIFADVTTDDCAGTSPLIDSQMNAVIPPLIEQCIADMQEQRFREPLPLCISRSYRIGKAEGSFGGGEAETAAPYLSKTPAVCIIELELDTVCYELSVLNVQFGCSTGSIYLKNQAKSIIQRDISEALRLTLQKAFRSPADIRQTAVHITERKTYMSNTASFGVFNLFSAAYLAAVDQILIAAPLKIEKIPVYPQDVFRALTGAEAL